MRALVFVILALVCGCGEKSGDSSASSAAPAGAPVQGAAPIAFPAAAPASPGRKRGGPALQEAVAVAGPAAPGGPDLTRQVFDGDRSAGRSGAGANTALSALGADGAVRIAPTKKDVNFTAPARKSTLTVGEPPAPGSTTTASGAGSRPPGADADGRTAAAPAGAAAGAKPDASGKPRVLVVGDSHSVGAFGAELVKKLAAARPGQDVKIYAVGGSSPWWFSAGKRVKGPASADHYRNTTSVQAQGGVAKLSELLTPQTKLVVVALGTNQIDFKAAKANKLSIFGLASGVALAREIKAAGAECVWIGPPAMCGEKGTEPASMRASLINYDTVVGKQVEGLCAYVSSDDKTAYEGGDCIHYYAPAARRWADAVASAPALAPR